MGSSVSTIGSSVDTIGRSGSIISPTGGVIGRTGSTIGSIRSIIIERCKPVNRPRQVGMTGRIRGEALVQRSAMDTGIPPRGDERFHGIIAVLLIIDSIRVTICPIAKRCKVLDTATVLVASAPKKKKKNSLDPSASIRDMQPRCVLLQAGHEIGSILARIVKRAFHIGGEVHQGALKGR